MSLSRQFTSGLLKHSSRFWGELALRIGSGEIKSSRIGWPQMRRLWDAEVSVFSQWGEDGILDFLCESLDLGRPNVVEFGTGNFLECNSRFLAEYRNARVMAVDAQDDLAATVRRLPIFWRTTIEVRQQWITPASAPALLAEARQLFGSVDIVSLDIDGNDYWVAESLDLAEVSVVVVEYNALFGSSRATSVPRNDSFSRSTAHFSHLYYGASLKAFVDLFAARGFGFIGTNRAGNNAFFVPTSRLHEISVPLPSDLRDHVDWRVRESRDATGNLTFLSGPSRSALIGSMALVDTATGVSLTVAEAAAG